MILLCLGDKRTMTESEKQYGVICQNRNCFVYQVIFWIAKPPDDMRCSTCNGQVKIIPPKKKETKDNG